MRIANLLGTATAALILALAAGTASPAFAEDEWQRLQIGSIEFAAAKLCPRCVLTTIDPNTSEQHPHQEPLRTLGSYRRQPDQSNNFGHNLIPRGSGKIGTGNRIEIL